MNKKFIVGHKYKLRDDYPTSLEDDEYIKFEDRETWWTVEKQPFFDKKSRKVIQIECVDGDSWMVIFEGITNGGWHYHPEDFVETDTLKHFLGQGD